MPKFKHKVTNSYFNLMYVISAMLMFACGEQSTQTSPPFPTILQTPITYIPIQICVDDPDDILNDAEQQNIVQLLTDSACSSGQQPTVDNCLFQPTTQFTQNGNCLTTTNSELISLVVPPAGITPEEMLKNVLDAQSVLLSSWDHTKLYMTIQLESYNLIPCTEGGMVPDTFKVGDTACWHIAEAPESWTVNANGMIIGRSDK